MINERWVILQPTHLDCRKLPADSKWSNDSFNNISRLFNAQLFHITNDNIDTTGDVYWLINFDINLIEKELAFLKMMKEKGKKIIVGFSQDRRFLMGHGLISNNGTLYTELCEIADIIGGGLNPDYEIFGRYQHKVVPYGEIFEEVNYSILPEQRNIDFMVSGEKNGDTLALELELMLMIKEKYPDKRIAQCIPNDVTLKKTLINKYPKLEFLDSTTPFITWLQHSKYYCNMEIRPRGGRCMIESYYCRVPFISSSYVYHSNLCKEFTYGSYNLKTIFNCYEYLLEHNYNELINTMEQRAENDKFDAVYSRIKEKLYI
jgi:hypothetical protein